jgi:hypothetical protein
MYHFGTQDGSEPAPGDVLTSGIESHLASLKNDIDNLASGTDVISDLVDATELDSVVTSGTYRRASSPLSGKNYPELSAGLLSVTATSGNAIYQFYQTIGGSSGTNKIFWRGRDAANAWSNWAEASKAGHNHDTLYYTETEIDEKIDPQSALTANSVVVTDANKKITSSSIISSTELGYLNEVTSNIQDQLNDRYTKSESARVFVQQTQPTGASTGDIWLW